MKGPWNEVSKNDLLLLAVAAACSTALSAPCNYVEIQVQGVELKCSSCCLVAPHTDVGANAGPKLEQWLGMQFCTCAWPYCKPRNQ